MYLVRYWYAQYLDHYVLPKFLRLFWRVICDFYVDLYFPEDLCSQDQTDLSVQEDQVLVHEEVQAFVQSDLPFYGLQVEASTAITSSDSIDSLECLESFTLISETNEELQCLSPNWYFKDKRSLVFDIL